MYCSERTTTTSVVNVSGSGGNDVAMTSMARSDCGLFVGAPSVVRLSPRSTAITAIARTTAAIQAPITRHGCLALAVAMVCVDSVTALSSPLTSYAASSCGTSSVSPSVTDASAGRRFRGISSVTTAPTPTTTAPTQMAGTRPSVKVCGDA